MTKSKVGKVAAAVGGGLILAGLLFSFFRPAASTSSAVLYLKSKPVSPWTAMALAAAGEASDTSAIQNVTGTNAIDYEAPILALAAAGKDPRTAGGTDLVAKLKTFYNNSQLGDTGILNDDIFGLLALLSVGESQTDTAVAGTKTFILSKQNSDGGWGYAVGGTSDTNTTAAAVMALIKAGTSSGDAVATKALAYLVAAQNADGGFPYDPQSKFGTDSDSSSDAWVIMALRAAGRDPGAQKSKDGKDPIAHLGTLLTTQGYYAYQAGSAEDSFSPTATAYAVIALSNKYLPVGTVTPAAVRTTYRIEGKTATLCRGEADAHTALDVLVAAGKDCGVTYHVKTMSFGSYVDQIGADKEAGSQGWLYLVNAVQPSVGAGDYSVKSRDDVVWYYGDFAWLPSRLSLGQTEATSGSPVAVTVELFGSGVWSGLGGATVRAGTTTVQTGTDGKANLNLPDGSYQIYAEKDGYVRTNTVGLVVGAKTQAEVSLSADLVGGVPPPGGSGSSNGGSGSTTTTSTPAVAFTVQSTSGGSSLNFGSITSGASLTRTVQLQNQGQRGIVLESNVTGDDLFRNYLYLDQRTWRMWRALLNQGESKNAEVLLSVPSGISANGTKNGKLVFWATPAP